MYLLTNHIYLDDVVHVVQCICITVQIVRMRDCGIHVHVSQMSHLLCVMSYNYAYSILKTSCTCKFN